MRLRAACDRLRWPDEAPGCGASPEPPRALMASAVITTPHRRRSSSQAPPPVPRSPLRPAARLSCRGLLDCPRLSGMPVRCGVPRGLPHVVRARRTRRRLRCTRPAVRIAGHVRAAHPAAAYSARRRQQAETAVYKYVVAAAIARTLSVPAGSAPVRQEAAAEDRGLDIWNRKRWRERQYKLHGGLCLRICAGRPALIGSVTCTGWSVS